jgi:hypothetical protein
MLFALLLLPIAILSACLAWLSWRARHRQVAFVMTCICLVCSGLAIGAVLAGVFFYEML